MNAAGKLLKDHARNFGSVGAAGILKVNNNEELCILRFASRARFDYDTRKPALRTKALQRSGSSCLAYNVGGKGIEVCFLRGSECHSATHAFDQDLSLVI